MPEHTFWESMVRNLAPVVQYRDHETFLVTIHPTRTRRHLNIRERNGILAERLLEHRLHRELRHRRCRQVTNDVVHHPK